MAFSPLRESREEISEESTSLQLWRRTFSLFIAIRLKCHFLLIESLSANFKSMFPWAEVFSIPWSWRHFNSKITSIQPELDPKKLLPQLEELNANRRPAIVEGRVIEIIFAC